MKKTALLLCAFILSSLNHNTLQAQNIVINEILASNTASIQDENSSHQDWIELYNAGASSVNLLGFGLSDDPLLLYKWTFPNVSLGAGQYLIVWASDKNRSVAGSPLHTNFKISASGENIYLTNTSAVTINTVPAASLQADISYGRSPNGTGPYVFFGTPTPNAANTTTGYSQALNPPVFSQGSGFLTTGFNLTISSPDAGTTILYTLDGSEPDENNLSGTTYNYKNQYPKLPGQAFGSFLYKNFRTQQYTAPIAIADRSSQANKISAISTTYDFTPPYIPNGPIYKGNIIRAKVIKPGALSSKVVTKNYFITPSGPSKYSIPVISLSIDEDQLFDYEDGISVAGVDFDNWRTANPNEVPDREIGNFERSGAANERKANMHYFVNGQEMINQDVGIRIRGAYSRVYPSKSWNIAARSDFGDENMSYKFFTDESYTSYERLSAKSGGSDFYNTMFRDALNHQLVKDLRMETETFQPMVTFMNGEYWGLLNLREKYDNNYFKQVYDIDAVDMLENQGAIQEGDDVDYNNMYNYISSNTFTSDTNYTYIQTRMDTDNFIDYFTTNIYAQNNDWPGNNIIYWRKKTAGFVANAPYGHDGRWRWALHDMDSTLEDPTYNSLRDATSTTDVGPNPTWSTLILRKLLANTNFKNDFINRFADLMNTNFLPARTNARIDEIAAIIAPEMNDQFFRWKAPADYGDWQYHIGEEKTFFNQRPTQQRNHIRTKFGISSNINATLNVSNYNHGYIKISTINIIDGTPGISGNPYPWTGVYFSGIPLKLKAIAKPGYIFSNWTGASTSTNAEITITPTANFSITAVFIPDGNVDVTVPIYFWMMDGNIVNGAQLTALNSTYELASNGVIQYQSCNTGYPTTNAGKSSMERRNLPTTINYRQAVNGNIPYASADMKGIQIKQPFQSGGLENTMVFNFSTTGYKKIQFSFAAIDEGAASAIAIDYAVNSGTPVWITTGLAATSLPLTAVYQLFQVDFSTITTVDNNANFKIRLRFTGPNMTDDLGKRVTFNNIAVDGVKIPLSYLSPNVYNVGSAITNLVPSTTQVMTSYSVSPSLPTGLTLNTSTGVISGTPTVASTINTYIVTGNYATGSASFDLKITITDGAPNSLSYASPNVYTRNTGISDLEPTSSGGAVVSYSINPALPTGLNFNTTTGIISGIPTVVTPMATYTVTATNSGGSTSFGIVITVKDIAPSGLAYNSPNVFIKNMLIADLSPTNSGGTVVSYNISPTLPTGLSFNTTTGVISGTPTVVSASATYTVTATNTGGSTTFGVVIRVNDTPPSNLSYNTPNVFTKGTAISNLNPTVTGAVTSYSITPSLSTGLTFNTSTGRISGTPTAIRVLTTYTVTATNSGGSSTFDVVITVNDIAPNGLSYTSPNVFTIGTAISSLNPTVSGGAVTNYSITPSLSTGLTFNTTTGRISGTPTAIRALTTYTVTATNSGGSTTFDVVITVNDIAPNGLSYTSPNTYIKNTTISSLNPTVSGGAVISYSITPSLPLGLSFDTTTGEIFGTPTAVSASTTYTVTATNSGGFTSFGVVIRVNDAPPSNLSYNTPNVFTKGTAISSLNPTVTGTVTSYSITPSLSTGLTFNTITGRISGTPTAIRVLTTYTVTATNSGGSTTFDVVITVNDIAPSGLSYNSPNVFTKGTAISSLNPSISGGAVTSYSITPSLSTGLTFNTTTGRISGTPTAIRALTTYTVTATNSGGSTTFDVVITVNDIAPNGLSYTSPNTFIKNTTISNLNPTVSGGVVISYSITPSLPLGLSFDTTTGEIFGTPTAVSASATYIVTATNSGGFTSFGVVIRVNDIAPSGLSYNTPNVFTKGTAISSLNPSISGGAVTSYSITPSLSTGLTFNTATGAISGTPTVISSATTYSVTANNSGGSTTFDVVITVNDIAPNGLSYTSPNVFTKGALIASLFPTISGSVIDYSITPSLPLGLNFDTATGAISGTPTVISSVTTYSVTANNSGGSTTFDVVITVNDIAPSGLSYTSPNVFTKGALIASLFPTISGSVIDYSITPSLPLGLNFDTATGAISGTPTVISSATTYSVTANNSGGSTTFDVVITVNDIAPSALSYNSPNVFTKGTAISSLNPSISGGAVTSYSITPSLSTGLTFNTSTGRVSGTPTVISNTTTYTVTATNSGGSITFDLVITVNDIAPSALTYNSPNVFTKGTAISSLNPSISSGAVTSYSITPSLPLGLTFNTSTGRISGTPTVISNTTTYTVTATNSGGSITFDVVITVNDVAPNTLSYNSPNVFTKGSLIASLFPTISGSVIDYSITPSLPLGLNFNTATGAISGTPTVITSATTYTVTANNSGGSITFDLVITVNDIAPSALSYNSPNVFTKGTAIASLNPSISGGTVTGYSITPSLSTGLTFNTATGRISGTPTAIRTLTTYTITANNSGGSTTFDVVITVNDIAPSALSYNSPNVFTKGTAIASLNPSISGGTVTGYSITPTLSTGLNFNTATGRISGTPTVISNTTTYTVTATNSGGSITFDVVITVNDVAPNTLSYNSPNVFTKGTAISSLNPSISGGAVTSYSITPSLSTGLTFNTSTGRISGTPTVISNTTTYTVTATNSGGSITFDLVITVNDVAPSALSYTSQNVFTNGTSIVSLFPIVSGSVIDYSITPSLPLGLNFDTATGAISGTPTVISSVTTYTVTANNSGGSTTFDLVITVNDLKPSDLNYNTPNVFTKDAAISNLNPSVSGGMVISYSISPSLPLGLNFDTVTGAISGTPTVISSATTYTVTANNSGGSTTFDLVITVNDLAPSALSYNSQNVFTNGTSIVSLFPTVSGTVIDYSITPSLPLGLSFDTATGEISGTPTVITSATTYTVTANNSGGSTTFDLVITVNDLKPSDLNYNTPNVFTKDAAISNLNPSVSGGTVISYSISPSLPLGLNFDTATGAISGTPTVISSATTYTVTANNSGGSSTFDLVITVNDVAPSALSYNSQNVFTNGTSIVSLFPIVSGSVIDYSITPSLPLGLNFDTATGAISGTPTVISSAITYTITANNSGGSITFDLIITVNDVAPSDLNYSTPNVFTKDAAISNLNPSVSGGTVISYSISPSLPLGLNFNTATGAISGTPTVISSATTYTVTANNSGGSSTFDLVITVNDLKPSDLNYSTPNVFTKDAVISNLSPSVSGGTVISYSIAPSLPLGLNFDTATGAISGTPTVISSATTYTVTAYNLGGSSSFDLIITVNDIAPNMLSYTSPNLFIVGNPIASLWPSVIGDVIEYSVNPALPLGLSLNTISGEISGTPTAIFSTAVYTVTATNSGGSIAFDIEIAVDEMLNNHQNNFENITVYPNPFDNIIHLSSNVVGISYQVFSIDGKLIQTDQLQNNKIEFRDLPTGIYLLQLFAEGKSQTLKIIKR